MIVAAHQTMMAPPALPYDAEVEYLESTGTQYIDTGVQPSGTTVFRADIESCKASGVSFRDFFGYNDANTTYNSLQLQISKANNAMLRANTTDAISFGSWNSGERKTVFIDLANRTATIGGTTNSLGTSPGTMVANYNIGLFCTIMSNGTGARTVGIGLCRYYSCEIYSGSVLVRSYVPIRIGQVGYLFDRVSGTLFGNAGTGAFVIGPDVT